MKVLVLGGYGVFGGRLAELLSDIAGLDLIISGRTLARAQDFCTGYLGQARVLPLCLDRADIEQGLRDIEPDLVVDASGPFQDYGAHRYGVIRACIASGTHYLDFADAADFVFGVSQFDAEAQAAGVFVLSGVSSFPVLTAAVLHDMAHRMDIVTVTGGIAPSPYAGIGLNVMRAVVGYAGAPVKLLRNGVQTDAVGLGESMRFTITVPGQMPLRNIHFSLVDVPDLQVIPPQHPTMQDIWIGAGPVPELLHRCLNLLARGRARFGLPSLAPLSGVFYHILNLAKFGEHRGGMFVQAKGMQGEQPVTETWHLLAEGDDGPYIPSMAVEAVLRKYLAGTSPNSGARAATGVLDLADYDDLFEGRSIFAGFRDAPNSDDPIYRQVLGSAFDLLPAQLRALHGDTATRRWAGRASVRRGKGVMARLVGRIFGFPPETPDIPVSVTLSPEPTGERWTRDFGGRIFSSFQSCGAGRSDGLLLERFGLISVALALVIDDDRLFPIPRQWSCLGVPLPRMLLPQGQSFETESDGDFCFDVEIAAPVIGLIVSYKGRLRPD